MTIFLIVHNINYYEKIKKYYEENVHYYLENTGKILKIRYVLVFKRLALNVLKLESIRCAGTV